MPSGVRSDDSGRASERTENGLSLSHRDYILDRFAVGSDKTPGAYNDRDFGGWSEGGSFETKSGARARPSLGRRHMSTCANLDSNLGGHIAHVG